MRRARRAQRPQQSLSRAGTVTTGRGPAAVARLRPQPPLTGRLRTGPSAGTRRAASAGLRRACAASWPGPCSAPCPPCRVWAGPGAAQRGHPGPQACGRLTRPPPRAHADNSQARSQDVRAALAPPARARLTGCAGPHGARGEAEGLEGARTAAVKGLAWRAHLASSGTGH